MVTDCDEFNVFISYSRRDYVDEAKNVLPGNIISQIKNVFDENKITYWMDEKGIYSGDEFAKVIAGYIRRSKIFLFVSTENSNSSEWTSDEIAVARMYKKKIIPFRYDDSEYNESVIVFIAKLDYIDYFTNPKPAFQKLVSSIKQYLGDRKDPKIQEEIIKLSDSYQQLSTQQESIINQIVEKNQSLGNTTKQCPVCDTMISIEASYCNRCGWSFSALYGMGGNYSRTYDKAQRALCQANWASIAKIGLLKNEMREQEKLANEKIDLLNKKLYSTQQELNETIVKLRNAEENPKLPPFIQQIIDDLVYVDGGAFLMGATPEQESDCREFEKPVHEVLLDSFYIGRTPVTQQQWEAVMGYNPSCFKGEKLPVEQVSWVDCHKFINKLKSLTGKKFRLLTEAEWEFAARGGIKSHGTIYAGGDTFDDVAWYKDNSDSKTHPVATKSPNELGLYDMSGNVWEWCQDWDGKYPSGSVTNPKGPTSGSYRLFRGGSWCSTPRDCRISYRNSYAPTFTSNYLGFRLAL